MDTQYNLDQNTTESDEIRKMRQMLAKNIDHFKFLVLSNMVLEEKGNPSAVRGGQRSREGSNERLILELNRISDVESSEPENLEAWVAREFAPKTVNKPKPAHADEIPGETLEQWVARQGMKTKARVKQAPSKKTFMDSIEEWLMNEAKKDLYDQMDTIYGDPEGLSSSSIRELGQNLIALADKLDRINTMKNGV